MHLYIPKEERVLSSYAQVDVACPLLFLLPSLSSTTAYLPEMRQPGSSRSSRSETSKGTETTTSDLMVRSEATGGAPGSLASGPMATSNGVLDGAWQS